MLAVAGCSSPTPGTATPTYSSTPHAAATAPATPTGVAIPRIGAKSSLVATGLNPDGTVEVPDVHRPGQASYYRLGPLPGTTGAALLLGHVNGDGQVGVFSRIHELHAGDEIDLTTSAGAVRFDVYKVDLISKDAFTKPGPNLWASILAQTPTPELRLVTCGGVLDRAHHNYLSNWVVFARKA